MEILRRIEPKVEALFSVAIIVVVDIGLDSAVCAQKLEVDFEVISRGPIIWG